MKNWGKVYLYHTMSQKIYRLQENGLRLIIYLNFWAVALLQHPNTIVPSVGMPIACMQAAEHNFHSQTDSISGDE